jgi:hypothetical protein
VVSPVDGDGPLAGDLAGIVDTLAAVGSHRRIIFGARIGAMLLGAMTAAAQQSPSVNRRCSQRPLRDACPLLGPRPAAGTRADQSSRWTMVQLIEKPELPNLPPPGPVIKPSWTNVRI